MAQIINIQERVYALDRLILGSKVLDAVQAFFHPDVVTMEGNDDDVRGIAQVRSKLIELLKGIEKVNGITLHNQTVNGDVTMSEFTFDFMTVNGEKVVCNEIIRRIWKEGLVIEERYYTAK